MRLLFLALSLSSSVVLAQTTTTSTLQLTIGGQVNDTFTLGGPTPDCGLTRTVTWSLNSTAQACNEMPIWITTATSCPDAPASGDFTIATATTSELNNSSPRSGTANFTVNQLPGFSGGDGGSQCGQQGVSTTYRVCAAVKLLSGTFGVTCDNVTTFTKGNTLKVVYDTQAPSAPKLDSVASLDSALSVHVSSNGGDPTEFRVEVQGADGSVVTSRQQTVDTAQFRLDGLQNGVTYRVVGYALDQAGNVSTASEPQDGTPVKTQGFYERYRGAGGQEQGGCDVAGGGLAGGAMLAALGFWLSSRRNRS